MARLSVATDLATCQFVNITKNGACLNKAYNRRAEKSALFVFSKNTNDVEALPQMKLSLRTNDVLRNEVELRSN